LTFDSLSSLLGDVIWEVSVIDINPAKNRHVINERGMICIGLTVREDVRKVFFEGTTYVRTLKNSFRTSSRRERQKIGESKQNSTDALASLFEFIFYARRVALLTEFVFSSLARSL